MSDTFWAGLLGAVIGASAALGVAWIAYKGALRTESNKAERQAIADLIAAAYDFDAAMLVLLDTWQEFGGPGLFDEDVRRTGRVLDRLAYLVRDAELRRLALELEKIGFGQRVLGGSPPPAGPDMDKVRKARDAVAGRASELIKTL